MVFRLEPKMRINPASLLKHTWLGPSPRIGFSGSEVQPEKFVLLTSSRWGWCHLSGDHTLRTTGRGNKNETKPPPKAWKHGWRKGNFSFSSSETMTNTSFLCNLSKMFLQVLCTYNLCQWFKPSLTWHVIKVFNLYKFQWKIVPHPVREKSNG